MSNEMRYLTNFEYIKSRNTEEFAEFMKNRGCPPINGSGEGLKCLAVTCKDCWLTWLREKGPEIGKLEV